MTICHQGSLALFQKRAHRARGHLQEPRRAGVFSHRRIDRKRPVLEPGLHRRGLPRKLLLSGNQEFNFTEDI